MLYCFLVGKLQRKKEDYYEVNMAYSTTATLRDPNSREEVSTINGKLIYIRGQRRESDIRRPSLAAQFTVPRKHRNQKNVLNPAWVPGLLMDVDNKRFAVQDALPSHIPNSKMLILFILTDGRPL